MGRFSLFRIELHGFVKETSDEMTIYIYYIYHDGDIGRHKIKMHFSTGSSAGLPVYVTYLCRFKLIHIITIICTFSLNSVLRRRKRHSTDTETMPNLVSDKNIHLVPVPALLIHVCFVCGITWIWNRSLPILYWKLAQIA